MQAAMSALGSGTDITAPLINVRFTPKSGHCNRHAYHLRRSIDQAPAEFVAVNCAVAARQLAGFAHAPVWSSRWGRGGDGNAHQRAPTWRCAP